MIRVVLIAGVCLCVPSFLAAQEAEPDPAAVPTISSERDLVLGEAAPGVPVDPQGPVSFFVILRTILVLLLAAAAIYGIVYFLKRVARPQELRDPNLRVLASAQLGQSHFVHAIALGTKVWLVGSGEGGVTHIADIEEQEAIDVLLLEESRRNAGGGQGRFLDFRAMLRRFTPSSGKGFTGPSAGNSTGNSTADNIRKRGDRLKGL
ncbi:MAG: flagellar biosynthetic protein FliO [Treponema sp.]|nr:flagellar biosynthetic protein FliO [Treponema sp.]